jgi:hypothetical protein
MTDRTGRLAVAAIAGVFVLAGILGLAAGADAGVVHLGFGLTGFAVVRSAQGTRRFLIGGGVLYVLWHFVLVGGDSTSVSVLSTNDWLNLWLAGTMIALACLMGDRKDEGREPADVAIEWRREPVWAANPSNRPRRPRPAAGIRPPVRRRGVYSPA